VRAVALDFETRRLGVREIAPPTLSDDQQVLFQVREVGVCGTDRELALFHFGRPPQGESFLVLGHEVLGQVVETGRAVTALKPGDWVTAIIRRACQPPCASCRRGRRDLCLTGKYDERGIFGRHGYFTEYAVDAAEDLVRVPAELVDRAVLIEPLSVVEKALERALRLHQGEPRRATVVGAGPVGILAALALQARGLRVAVWSLEAADHPRAKLLREAGVEYSNAAVAADIVIEATGFRAGADRALACIGPLGVCAILGAADVTGEGLLRRLIVNNQTVFGSVNSSPQSFRMAMEDLERFDPRTVARLIRRVRFEDFEQSILGSPGERPKIVHVLDEPSGR
jgi:glucose 1-dehydrogenase